jgi:hypothetical protein
MKIVETVEVSNEEKVFMGHKDLRLTLDTETRRVEIDTPAMFTNPVLNIDQFEATLAKLKGYADKALEGG